MSVFSRMRRLWHDYADPDGLIHVPNLGWGVAGEVFPLGTTWVSNGALSACESAGERPRRLFERHASGDWGDVDDEDRARNDANAGGPWPVVSQYRLRSRRGDELVLRVVTTGEKDHINTVLTCVDG